MSNTAASTTAVTLSYALLGIAAALWGSPTALCVVVIFATKTMLGRRTLLEGGMATKSADGVHHPTPAEEAAARTRTGNLPATGLSFTNSRGSVLHVRCVLPPGAGAGSASSSSTIVASVLLLHGYAAHTNRRSYTATAERLAARGFAVLMYDQEGHGRSDGLPGYIPDTELLVDDAERAFQLLADPIATASIEAQAKPELDLTPAVRMRLSQVPFFALGQSMGGSLAARLASRLHGAGHPRFAGAIMLCPALEASLPPLPVYLLLKYVIAPLFRRTRMPETLDAVSDNSKIWVRDEDIRRVEADNSLPGGLATPGSMRFGTGVALLALLDRLAREAPSLRFPFLILHDPEDAVCKFSGSERLHKLAATPADDKSLIHMKGMKHDLITNCTQKVADEATAWMLQRVGSGDK